jgi:hypothetical protein
MVGTLVHLHAIMHKWIARLPMHDSLLAPDNAHGKGL